jgi:DNA polymerase
MSVTPEQQLRAYVEYLRDMGVYDLYRRDNPSVLLPEATRERLANPSAAALEATGTTNRVAPPVSPAAVPRSVTTPPVVRNMPTRPPASAAPLAQELSSAPPSATPDTESFSSMPKPRPLDDLLPIPAQRIPAANRVQALEALRAEIGDCTRCPLAYAGRRKIVFADGDPNARLMFVGEGPGADEDESGVPFVGKAGQLLNNMITAMGLRREDVYIANIVKCRPPANRTPEFVEASTCSPFLAQQIDIVRPEVIVALGATAATYLLGVKQSLASLRGHWHSARGAKVAVTYHPAFLLRDPRQKGEAWKDLQRVMAEMGLKTPARPS